MNARSDAKTPGVAEYEPFTDSIRADIAALPNDVRGELVDDLAARYGRPAPANWSVVAWAAFTPIAVLLSCLALGSLISEFHRGLMLGIAAAFGLDVVAAVVSASQRQIAIWRRSADTRRGQR